MNDVAQATDVPARINAPRGRRSFVSTSTADRWYDGVLTGGGRVGALVWGGPEEHVIALSHERFFLPVHPRPLPPPLAGIRAEARAALLRGDAAAAAQVVSAAVAEAGYDQLIWTDPLAPCSELRLRFGGGAADDYRRAVDFESGQVRLTWDGGGREVLVSAPRGTSLVEVRVRSSTAARVDLHLGMPREEQADLRGAVNYARTVTATSELSGEGARFTVTPVGRVAESIAAVTTLAGGPDLPADLRVDADGIDASLLLEAGVWSILRLEVTVVADRAPSSDAVELGDHAALQRASWLDLRSGFDEAVPTELLLAQAPRDDATRRALVELAYAAGRYTIISATGEIPATLQGVWQGTWSPAWSADYTMNGNVQNGGIASLVPTGTPELIRSLVRLLVPHLEDFRTNAARLYGLRGAMLPSRMSSHGLANHFNADFPHEFWTSCGGWVVRVLADAVLATGDRTLVDDATWDLVQDVLRFYEDLVAEGTLGPAYSPENTPRGAATALTLDPAMDVAVLRDAVRAGRVLAEARGAAPVEYDLEARYRVQDGRLAEWSGPGQPDQMAHRHVSQLYPLWYDVDPAFEEPELRAAAARLVREKIAWRAEAPTAPPGHMEMAFGLAQLGLAAAALGDAESAEQCVRWLAELHVTPAMTTTHDAGVIFNVDACGGLPAVVAAMLVGSTRRRIDLLPALPASWPAGAAGGLTTRTGLRIERLEWDVEAVHLDLRATAESDWVRADGVDLRLPRPVLHEGRRVDRVPVPPGHEHTFHLTWA